MSEVPLYSRTAASILPRLVVSTTCVCRQHYITVYLNATRRLEVSSQLILGGCTYEA